MKFILNSLGGIGGLILRRGGLLVGACGEEGARVQVLPAWLLLFARRRAGPGDHGDLRLLVQTYRRALVVQNLGDFFLQNYENCHDFRRISIKILITFLIENCLNFL